MCSMAVTTLTRSTPVPAQKALESTVGEASISCMASGDTGSTLKYYFYAVDAAGPLYLSEVVVDKSGGKINIQMKTTGDAKQGQAFVDLLGTQVFFFLFFIRFPPILSLWLTSLFLSWLCIGPRVLSCSHAIALCLS
jgi:hypothetical protein